MVNGLRNVSRNIRAWDLTDIDSGNQEPLDLRLIETTVLPFFSLKCSRRLKGERISGDVDSVQLTVGIRYLVGDSVVQECD